jgi:hypothetical protein
MINTNTDGRQTLKLFGEFYRDATWNIQLKDNNPPLEIVTDNNQPGRVLFRQVFPATLDSRETDESTKSQKTQWTLDLGNNLVREYTHYIPAADPAGTLLPEAAASICVPDLFKEDTRHWTDKRIKGYCLVERRLFDVPTAENPTRKRVSMKCQVLYWQIGDTDGIRPGQVWEDRDLRRKGRKVVVQSRNGDMLTCYNQQTEKQSSIVAGRLKRRYQLVTTELVLWPSVFPLTSFAA